MSSEPAPHRLLLLRHGESVWNEQGLFTGWVDVGLSERGTQEAVHAGELLATSGPPWGTSSTPQSSHERSARPSSRSRSPDASRFPWSRTWRLNERHYGDLQGKSKEQTRLEYGDEQYMLWRRSYDVPPPPLAAESRTMRPLATRDTPGWHPTVLPGLRVPKGRARPGCSRTGTTRSSPDLLDRRLVLVSAHGNSLRALAKHLEQDPGR